MRIRALLPLLVSACSAAEAAAEPPAEPPAVSGASGASGVSAYEVFTAPQDGDCPPCFNCMLPAFSCKQYGHCNEYNGQCECPPGFAGQDCGEPLCGGLSDGFNRPIRSGKTCDCSSGWSGINCNVCAADDVCNAFMPDGSGGVCYKGGLLVETNHQMCNVTNKKILDILDGRIPQVTFSCNATAAHCNFQFWIDAQESFYCDLTECSFEADFLSDTNKTHYKCENAACACVPGRMLCGEKGSIDISDFLSQTIRGPADYSCDERKHTCRFSEPSMDDLIKTVFGDSFITLECSAGECLHYSQLPGYAAPPKRALGLRSGLAMLAGAALLVVALGAAVWGCLRASGAYSGGPIKLPSENEDTKLMAGHTPVALAFRDVRYELGSRVILDGVYGLARPGEVMAIMGGSGAGKTTLLDILAAKNKAGTTKGRIYTNGKRYPRHEYRKIIAFVDQEDLLLPTLTVYETVLNSALLRLPRQMSLAGKKLRVLETLQELRILHIKDRLIGSSETRGISGGEKRRVAIACELVTSPAVLFLDEPTSGLDAYNAYNVVESLVYLARNYRRTIVFTIHQPRSNIVALFDQLVLLSEGRLVFSGPSDAAAEYFAGLGYPVPVGFNIADFLIDLTAHAAGQLDDAEGTRDDSSALSLEDISRPPGAQRADSVADAAVGHTEDSTEGHTHSLPASGSQEDITQEWDHYASHRDELHPGGPGGEGYAGRGGRSRPRNRSLPDVGVSLETLVAAFKRSLISETVLRGIQGERRPGEATPAESASEQTSDVDSPPPIAGQEDTDDGMATGKLTGRRKVGIVGQIAILSNRTFKNLYRNPQLLFTHYLISVMLAVFCGYLYFNISNDISGFQNRLGLFFFLLALFGFSTLSSLNLFASERVIFVRERANGYYHPFAYFFSKVVFDIIPLRVLPPVLLALIVYPMVGLSMENNGLLKFILVLVLFNLTAAATCLFIGIVAKDTGVANLIGVLFMLFSLLFAGLFLNKDSIPKFAAWLQYVSVFHYAYEALAVNEVRYLTLTERKYGLSIEIPGATILSTFGFDVMAYWDDVVGLSCFFLVFIVLGYVAMHVLLVEKR